MTSMSTVIVLALARRGLDDCPTGLDCLSKRLEDILDTQIDVLQTVLH